MRAVDLVQHGMILLMLARIRSEGLLTEDEFSGLSPETGSVIDMLLDSF